MSFVYGIFALFLSLNSVAMTVLNFNTMCDVCKGSDYFNYEQRAKQIKLIIEKYRPDLVSLQELRTESHLKNIVNNEIYHYHFTTLGPVSYADPSIAYKKEYFDLVDDGQFWLGKTDEFNLGWQLSLPRQVIWVRLKHKITGKEFIFASSHFDNLRDNLMGSAKKVNQYFRKFKVPIIFAADTNITEDADYYHELVIEQFLNAFDLKTSFQIDGEYQKDKDLCYLRKGKKFPQCRVDHILLSANTKWKVSKFIINTQKFNNKFPSDHRAVIIDLNFVK